MNKYLPINNNSYQHQTILHNTQLANTFVTYKFAVPKLPNTRKQRTVRQVLAKVSLSLPGLGFCGQYCKKRTFFCPCACPYVGIVIFIGKVGFFACHFNGMGADHQVYSCLKCLLHNNRNTRPKEKIDADYLCDQGDLATTSLLGCHGLVQSSSCFGQKRPVSAENPHLLPSHPPIGTLVNIKPLPKLLPIRGAFENFGVPGFIYSMFQMTSLVLRGSTRASPSAVCATTRTVMRLLETNPLLITSSPTLLLR